MNRGRQLRARGSASGVVWLYRGTLCTEVSVSVAPARFPVGVRRRRGGHDGHDNDNSAQRPSTRTPAADGEEQDRADRRWLDGRRPGSCRGTGRPPVHPGQRERAHRCCPAGVRVGLGVAGPPVGSAHRPAAALGGCAGAVFLAVAGLISLLLPGSVVQMCSAGSTPMRTEDSRSGMRSNESSPTRRRSPGGTRLRPLRR